MVSSAVMLIGLLVWLALIVLYAIMWWKIFKKAGYTPALGLAMLIPLVNFCLLLMLAFGEWPISRNPQLPPQPQQ